MTGFGRRVEVLLDVVEAENLTGRRHIQRAVAHGDAIGLTETAGDRQDLVGLVVAVAIDHGVDLAGILRPDEHGALRPERHHARVADVLGEHLELESRRNDQRAKRPRGSLTGEDRQAGGKRPGAQSDDETPCGSFHVYLRLV